MTFDELQELRNAISDIMQARDFLASKGVDVGGITTNNISNAYHQLLDEKDCEDYPKEEKKLKEGELDHYAWSEYFKL